MTKNFYAYLMCAGHLAADSNQGALSAILPFLIATYHYDYATIGSLVMFYSFVGSLIQPYFGQLADKHYSPWILPVALVLASCGMAMTGLTSSFPLLCLAVIVSGVGVAMFHPIAILIVNKTAPKEKHGALVSIFSFGGNMGFSVGPLVVGLALTAFGMYGTLALIIPALIVTTLLYSHREGLNKIMVDGASSAKKKAAAGKDNWNAFCRLCGAIFGRSVIFYGLSTFVTLYLIDQLGQTKAGATTILSVFFFFSAVSTLLGGRFADKYGYRTMARISFTIMFCSLLCFSLVRVPMITYLLLIPMGISLSLPYSSIVVLGQRFLPNRPGLAGGITLGLSVSIGGIITPLLGKLGDALGLSAVFYALTLIAIIPLISSYILPEDPPKPE